MARWTGVGVVLLVLLAGAAWGAGGSAQWEVMGDGYVPVRTAATAVATDSAQMSDACPMTAERIHSAMAGARWFAMGDGYVPGQVSPRGAGASDPCGAGSTHGCGAGLAYAPEVTTAGRTGCAM